MKVEINIEKIHALVIAASIFLLVVVGIATAYPDVIYFAEGDDPAIYGHTLGEIAMPFCTSGQVLGFDSSLGWSCKSSSPFSFNSCIYQRGDIDDKDFVTWCPLTHPKAVYCGAADDQAPNTGPTLVSTINTSPVECVDYLGGVGGHTESCDTSGGRRSDLGGDFIYFEMVRNSVGTQGCLSYDDGHNHTDYRHEMVCCQ